MSNLQKSPTYFCTSSYCFRDIIFLILDLEKVGNGHGVQFSQLHHSMTNVKIYKCLQHIFALALTISEIYIFKNFLPPKIRSRSWSAIFAITPKANVKIYKCLPQIFALALTISDI